MTDTTRPYHWGRPNPNYAGPNRATDASPSAGSAPTDDFATPAADDEPVLSVLFETTPLPPDDADFDVDDEYAYSDWAQWETETNREAVRETVSAWADGDHATDTVCIYGSNMGWTGADGHKVISTEDLLDDPVRAIAPRTSELSQEWSLEADGTLVARQGHHDSPMMGERYTFRFMTDDEAEAYEWGEWDPEDHRDGD